MGLRPSWTEHTHTNSWAGAAPEPRQCWGLGAGGSGSAYEPTGLKGKEEKTLCFQGVWGGKAHCLQVFSV